MKSTNIQKVIFLNYIERSEIKFLMSPKTTKNLNARTSWKVSNGFELLNLSEDGAKKIILPR